MKHLLYSLGLLVLFSGVAGAQQSGIQTSFSPIPIWPSDGSIPQELEDWYVYLDPGAGQIVLNYPEGLDQPGFERQTAIQKVERFNLNNQVDALIVATVQENKGQLSYRYRIENSKKARQSISSIKLVTPTLRDADSISEPTHWAKDVHPAYFSALPMGIGQTPGTMLSWSVDGQGVVPGSEQGGFQINSVLTPGFVWAYVQNGMPFSLPSDTPSSVLKQAAPMFQLGNNSQSVLTIAPKFFPGTDKLRIVADFHFGINHLLRNGQLNPDSPAIRGSLEVLEQYLEAAQQADNVPLDEWVGPPLVFNVAVQEGLEKEIVNALRLSLN